MIIGFKKQFKQPILDGTKIHTFREDPHARWKTGRKIHMATGVRTKKYNCFMFQYCLSVQAIQINYCKIKECYPAIFIDGQLLNWETIELLAKNDGFDSVEDFFKLFDKDFQGRIVHWTSMRY